MASILYLRFKNYYDSILKIIFNLKDSGSFGILFRVTDPFNYYALILDSVKKQKRLIKVINGKEKIIKEIDDGGFIVHQWYLLMIRMEMGMFDIYMEKHDELADIKDKNENNVEKIMYGYDGVFSSGSVGIGVNNLNQIVVNELTVEPVGCTMIQTELTT